MTQVRQTRQVTEWPMPEGRHDGMQRRDPDWRNFAASLLILAGAFQFIAGLTAILRSGYYQVGSNSLLVHVSYHTWGWSHIGVGSALVLLGLGAIFRLTVARYLGIAAAMIAAVVNLGFLPAFPFWSLIMIALDIIVIYALATHWGDWKARGRDMYRAPSEPAAATRRTNGHETRTGTETGARTSGGGDQGGYREDRDEVRAAADRSRRNQS